MQGFTVMNIGAMPPCVLFAIYDNQTRPPKYIPPKQLFLFQKNLIYLWYGSPGYLIGKYLLAVVMLHVIQAGVNTLPL
jgi:hypothetical protein